MKKKIAIVTGGDSGEKTISLKSAKNIEKYIDKEKFSTYLIMFRGAQWTYLGRNGAEIPVDKNDFSIDEDGQKVRFDAVFIAIHGTPGEDGKLQGYLDMLKIPYTSCDRTTSALTFNKFFCNQLVKIYGKVNISKSIVVRKKRMPATGEILREISLPCFVKPCESGSSIGVTKVKTERELIPAIEKAWEVDNGVLIENFIPGKEITCGVIDINGQIKALPVTEIISKNEYFDFDAKYDSKKADEITPARIPQHLYEECQQISRDLYLFFNCSGIVRFDYILTPDEKIYFLEVNVIPGLTDESIVPKQAEAAGIPVTELFTVLIEDTLNEK
ncbi:MAG: D-alanine--D-alanine ligase A [Bacteroidetes bacterium ADurb.Bin408]|nr:MAG: D-alanine--D-alanine ligase A [Bacteroidetes bacterium ADurb.Bin408]